MAARLSGYSHAITYRERVFHVRTELHTQSPSSVCSKVSLDDAVIFSRSVVVVGLSDADLRRLMQEQHRQAMRLLRSGAVDRQIDALSPSSVHAC